MEFYSLFSCIIFIAHLTAALYPSSVFKSLPNFPLIKLPDSSIEIKVIWQLASCTGQVWTGHGQVTAGRRCNFLKHKLVRGHDMLVQKCVGQIVLFLLEAVAGGV